MDAHGARAGVKVARHELQGRLPWKRGCKSRPVPREKNMEPTQTVLILAILAIVIITWD